jgi:hypothetical protein
MSNHLNDLVSTSLGEMRAAAFAWEGLEPAERRRRIREYLSRQASAASVDVEAFAAAVAAALPDGAAAGGSVAAERPASLESRSGETPSEPPKEPVDDIIGRIQSLTPIDRRRLLDRMRALDMLPPVPPQQPQPAPVRAPEPPPQPAPVLQPAPVRIPAGATISDEAFLALAAGFGVQTTGRRSEPMSVVDVETALARQGLKRSLLTADSLAIALGHFAKAVASMSEEGEQNAHGLPEAIRAVLPNSRRAPVEELKNYLAGVCEADRLHDYVDEYFEPYRQLSRRLPDLCRRLKSLADRLSPKDFEKSAPKTLMGAMAYDKMWDQYKERYATYARQGFGESEEATRVWLLRQWLN